MSGSGALSVHVIVFSKDRALQLDATLRSFYLHCIDAFESAQVTVLYKTSSHQHASQYQELQKAYPQVKFVAEKNFRRDLLKMLNPRPVWEPLYRLFSTLNAFGFRPGTCPDTLVRVILDPLRFSLNRWLFPAPVQPAAVLFLVDDNIFVRDFALADCMAALSRHPNALGLSLRLGRNTTYNYMASQPQSLPNFLIESQGILKFQWTDANQNFGYPLEVSSSIYPLAVILPLLLLVSFHNPNWLESALSLRAGFFRRSHPHLLCFERSITFCNPVNVVQTDHQNRAGKHYSADELAERFERGERLDTAAYSGFTPSACHQEVELIFTPSEML